MFKQKYIIIVESEESPELMVGEFIRGAEVISISREQYPDLVDLAWLTKRFPLSRQTLSEKLNLFNVGSARKAMYDPNVVIPFLKLKIKGRLGRPREN